MTHPRTRRQELGEARFDFRWPDSAPTLTWNLAMLPTQPGWAPGTFTRHRTPPRPVTPSRHERMNLRPGCALGSLTGSQVAFSSIRQVPGQHQEIALASLCWGKKKNKKTWLGDVQQITPIPAAPTPAGPQRVGGGAGTGWDRQPRQGPSRP